MTDTLREILGGGDFKGETSWEEHVTKAVARDGEGDNGQFSNRPDLGRIDSVEKVSHRKCFVEQDFKQTQGTYGKQT